MKFDFNWLNGWAAIITALVAIIALWIENRRSRFSLGLDLLIKLSSEFNSNDFKKKRHLICKYLLKKTKQKVTKKDREQFETSASELLDHFEWVGTLMHRGALDKNLVSSSYFYWVHNYWYCLQEYIQENREWDNTVWEEAEWLNKQLKKLEKKYQPNRDSLALTEKNMISFFEYEISLV